MANSAKPRKKQNRGLVIRKAANRVANNAMVVDVFASPSSRNVFVNGRTLSYSQRDMEQRSLLLQTEQVWNITVGVVYRGDNPNGYLFDYDLHLQLPRLRFDSDEILQFLNETVTEHIQRVNRGAILTPFVIAYPRDGQLSDADIMRILDAHDVRGMITFDEINRYYDEAMEELASVPSSEFADKATRTLLAKGGIHTMADLGLQGSDRLLAVKGIGQKRALAIDARVTAITERLERFKFYLGKLGRYQQHQNILRGILYHGQSEEQQ